MRIKVRNKNKIKSQIKLYGHHGIISREDDSDDLQITLTLAVFDNFDLMVLDTSLLNSQQYKVRIKGKVEQSMERSSALPYTSFFLAIEKEALWSPSTKGRQLYLLFTTRGNI